MQVKLRGESMQAASDAAESGMVSVIGLDSEKVKEICAAVNERLGSDAIQIANYLCPGNYAVSGSMEVRTGHLISYATPFHNRD
jgi:[acyl-carrier-protein] S-malonyltransferase